ncbi:hypothetical protein N9N28_10885 [Rubripirellula amarantea]|nr:hypothetical protein [Rubripirellula amarantea]
MSSSSQFANVASEHKDPSFPTQASKQHDVIHHAVVVDVAKFGNHGGSVAVNVWQRATG